MGSELGSLADAGQSALAGVVAALAGAAPAWLLAGVLLHVANQVARGCGWHSIVRAACARDAGLRRRETVAAWIAGAGCAGVLTARAGDALRVLLLARRAPAANAPLLAGTLVAESAGQLATGALVLLAALALGAAPGFAPGPVTLALAATIAAAALAAALVRMRRRRSTPARHALAAAPTASGDELPEAPIAALPIAASTLAAAPPDGHELPEVPVAALTADGSERPEAPIAALPAGGSALAAATAAERPEALGAAAPAECDELAASVAAAAPPEPGALGDGAAVTAAAGTALVRGAPPRRARRWLLARLLPALSDVRAGCAPLARPGAYLRGVIPWQLAARALHLAALACFLTAFHLPATPTAVLLVVLAQGTGHLVPFSPASVGVSVAALAATFAPLTASHASTDQLAAFLIGTTTLMTGIGVVFALAIALAGVEWRALRQLAALPRPRLRSRTRTSPAQA